jgi:hypothetical protein
MVAFVVELVVWFFLELIGAVTGVFLISLWRRMAGKSIEADIDTEWASLVGLCFWFVGIFLAASLCRLVFG